jgi:hypothetical protein
VYGAASLKRLGTLSYAAFAGHSEDTKHSGYIYQLSSRGIFMETYGGLNYGADLCWDTPAKGLLLGAAYMNQNPVVTARRRAS